MNTELKPFLFFVVCGTACCFLLASIVPRVDCATGSLVLVEVGLSLRVVVYVVLFEICWQSRLSVVCFVFSPPEGGCVFACCAVRMGLRLV